MPGTSIDLSQFTTFGDYLKFLRRRVLLSQRELSLAVGYSESQISRLESNQRAPDRSSLLALFVPALDLGDKRAMVARLLELAEINRQGTVGEQAARTPAEPGHTHLPAPLTSFVGRIQDLESLGNMLRDPQIRLITITGEGGCGKTRLALQAGAHADGDYRDGVWLVELGALSDPELVLNTTLAALNLNASIGQSLVSVLLNFIAARRLLLILDNCEHLIDAAAQMAANLLQACPNLTILATSREPLDIPGETIFRALPMSLPPAQRNMQLTRSHIETYESIQLFCARARSALHTFELTDKNAPAVARLCQRLDGIPLALELAATWVYVLSVEQIADKLEDDFDLLVGKNRYSLSQHQTLRAALDWSYQLLNPAERLLLRRLSIFAGGFNLDAVNDLCSLAEQHEKVLPTGGALELLARLVNKSLVWVGRREEGEARYRLLETVRAYAREKLEESGESLQVQDQHLAYYCDLAERSEQGLKTESQIDWMERLIQEQENFRSAFQACVAQNRAAEALRLAGALGFFWMMRGFEQENLSWLETALKLASREASLAQTLPRAKTLLYLGLIRDISVNFDAQITRENWEESLEISRACRNDTNAGAALCFLGVWYANQGQFETSRRVFEQSYHHLQREEDSWWIAETMH